VLLFACLVHHPIKFIRKYWQSEPTVGIREGDGFIHNDARYGNIHNTDQSLIMPIFHDGQLIAWAGATVHEGENGAIEPGGMPSAAEQVYDEGLKMSPFKVVEKYELKKDLVTYLQNSVREPKLQYEDMKVKLFVCRRLEQRVKAAIAEFGRTPSFPRCDAASRTPRRKCSAGCRNGRRAPCGPWSWRTARCGKIA